MNEMPPGRRLSGGPATIDPFGSAPSAAIASLSGGSRLRLSRTAEHQRRHRRRGVLLSWLQATPLALILAAFLIVPIAMIVLVSFWKFTGFAMVPGFVLTNYQKLFGTGTALALYLNTARLLLATYAATLILGYVIAYHLAFDIRRPATQTFLFALCIVPFLTSSVIRTISWVPFLGKNGIVNSVLLQLGIIHEPLSFLLFSDFAVVLCYTQMFTGFMVAPIFNMMVRIEPEVIEAARDAGASDRQIFRFVILPLTAPGAAIGTIFVVVMVVSDISIVRLIGGGQTGTVAVGLFNQLSMVQFPQACAAAVVLLVVVLAVVTPILRLVDIRRQL
jgi:putative spermidine/putrescine transport system permease protein